MPQQQNAVIHELKIDIILNNEIGCPSMYEWSTDGLIEPVYMHLNQLMNEKSISFILNCVDSIKTAANIFLVSRCSICVYHSTQTKKNNAI